jgi:cytochrome c oxidase subunit I+III
LLAWQGLHAFLLLLTGAYLVARSFAGALRRDARASWDNGMLLWHYANWQGIAIVAVVRLLPVWLGG